MNDQSHDHSVHDDPTGILRGRVAGIEHDSEARQAVGAVLQQLGHAAESAAREVPAAGVKTIGGLVEILSLAEAQQTSEIVEFVQRVVPVLCQAFDGSSANDDELESFVNEAQQRWGEWLELVGSDGPSDAHDEAWSGEEAAVSEDDLPTPTAEELAALLSSCGPNADLVTEVEVTELDEAASESTNPFEDIVLTELPGPPTKLRASIPLEGELLEAYLDDAGRCLAGIEASILAFEQSPRDSQPLQQICRELHTLKGASASVGLGDLASYLHHVEEYLEARCESPSELEAQPFLTAVDGVRDLIHSLQQPTASDPTSSPPARAHAEDLGGDSEETVRVKASQLDRLMDMLAELVMLRNGRDSRLTDLQKLTDELIRCGTRLRTEGDEQPDSSKAGRSANPLREVANDILEIARRQRDAFDGVASENLAVSRFIRNFRQELTEARRLPISGLFRRLQRAVHDAARIEGKRVQLQLLGGHAGLERSLQERLYEPLLHIVRNAVSHGVETESDRRSAGKSAEGTVTLEARGAPNLLVLEVRDDGRGLDYDAIRRRGIERGILPADHPASREELAQLIFHPGFSTREAANAVAGRGVGMDVVAEALNRMGAWVEVESVPSEGTSIRLSIPLPSVIEHAMVFRSRGQLFGIPMQHVAQAREFRDDTDEDDTPIVWLNELFGDDRGAAELPQKRLIVSCRRGVDSNNRIQGRQFVLLVDEIIGPEEVVVRPLPPLLRLQSLVSGVTLSGTGQLLLLLDNQRLVETAVTQPDRAEGDHQLDELPRDGRKRVLVVDDSISARRCLARAIKQFGLETVEASDGREALGLLRQESFSAVFSDLEMPRVGGFDLLHEIRETATQDQLPVAIVSSRIEEEYQSQAANLGAIAYLPKPVTERRVGDVLQQMGLLQRA